MQEQLIELLESQQRFIFESHNEHDFYIVLGDKEIFMKIRKRLQRYYMTTNKDFVGFWDELVEICKNYGIHIIDATNKFTYEDNRYEFTDEKI